MEAQGNGLLRVVNSFKLMSRNGHLSVLVNL